MHPARYALSTILISLVTLVSGPVFAQTGDADQAQQRRQHEAWRQRAHQREQAMDQDVANADALTGSLAKADGSDAQFAAGSAVHLRLLAGGGFALAPVFETGAADSNRGVVDQSFGGGLTMSGGVAFWPWQTAWAGLELWADASAGYAGASSFAMATFATRAGAQAYAGGSNVAGIVAVCTGVRLVGAQSDPESGRRSDGNGSTVLNRVGVGLRVANDARDSIGELIVYQEFTGVAARPGVARGDTTPLIFAAAYHYLNGVSVEGELALDYPTVGSAANGYAPDSGGDGGSVYAMINVSRSFDWVW